MPNQRVVVTLPYEGKGNESEITYEPPIKQGTLTEHDASLRLLFAGNARSYQSRNPINGISTPLGRFDLTEIRSLPNGQRFVYTQR